VTATKPRAASEPPLARFWEPLEGGAVRCGLCPHRCRIAEGALGACRTRRNVRGELRVITHGLLRAAAVDPVEKKPLFHYRPGSATFSIASAGCNLVCPFCQNHELSQRLRGEAAGGEAGRRTPAAEIVAAALERGCASIAFTYSEPVLSLELAEEVAAAARPEGIEIVFVTNGQVGREGADALGRILNAANVDLKCFDEEKYRRVLGGDLSATLDAIRGWRAAGVWVEVTTLVIPGFNDGDDELGRIAGFVAEVDPEIPWHVSRFRPDYRWADREPTPAATLRRAREIGLARGLRHVYTGNLPGSDGEKTVCSGCGALLIDRVGYSIRAVAVDRGRCRACGAPLAGVGLP
jgi:pyruvate formate lyase activating enzyme